MDLFAEEEAQSKATAASAGGGEEAGDTVVEQKEDLSKAESQFDLKGDDEKKKSKDGKRNSPVPMQMENPSAAMQLTIFYNGTISVFDAVPPEKAQAIMLIAAATAAAAKVTPNHTAAAAAAAAAAAKAPVTVAPSAAASAAVLGTTPVLTRSLSLQSSSVATSGGQPQLVLNSSNSLCKLQAELPLARRHSLQRFLEKRRDRLVSKAPYASAKSPDSAEVASKGNPQLA